MSTGDETKSAAVLNRFLREYAEDRAAGRAVSSADYEARFPGFEALVAREYARLCRPEEPAPGMKSFPPPFADGALGPYVLERELGRGGQGTVYLARDTRLGREVAIKVLGGVAPLAPETLERFRLEAALAARLDHPGICAVYESGEAGGLPYVVMRHVPGETLAERIAAARREEGGPPDLDWCLTFMERAARALQAAHEAGVIHRDVKPGNLMVTRDGEPVVLDFGLARDLEGEAITRSGDVFGTPSYMAPEQVDVRSRPDARTDVYSLGASLYHLVTLDPPFQAPTREGLYRKILDERPPDPSRSHPGIRRDLRVVLETALEKDPDHRYQTALDLAEDLCAVRESRPIAARPVGPLGRMWRWAGREPVLAFTAAAAGLALLLAAGLGGFLLARRPALAAGQLELDRAQRETLMGEAFKGRFTSQTRDAMIAVLEVEPDHGALRSALALLHYHVGDEEGALAVLDAAPPDTEVPRMLARMRATVLVAMGRAGEAGQIERELGEPREPFEYWFVARRLLEDTQAAHPEALALLERAIYSSPEPHEVFFVDLIRAAATVPDQAASDRAAEALERNHSESALAWFAIAMARALEDQEACVAALERSIEIDPDFPQALGMLATALLLFDEHERSSELFERAIANTSTLGERRSLRQAYARILETVGRSEEAVRALEAVLAEEPAEVETLMLLGELFTRGERLDEAAGAFGRALDADPANARARAALGL